MKNIRLLFEPTPSATNTKEQLKEELTVHGFDFSEWKYAGYISMNAFEKTYGEMGDVLQYFIQVDETHTKIPEVLPSFIIHQRTS